MTVPSMTAQLSAIAELADVCVLRTYNPTKPPWSHTMPLVLGNRIAIDES
jgi:hypothetical protein